MAEVDTAVFKEQIAAERLGAAVRTLQRWRARGCGPAYVRLGPRLVGYRAADLNSWMNSRTFPHRAAELARQAA